MKGEACLIRYADDFVCAFEYEADAKTFFCLRSAWKSSDCNWLLTRRECCTSVAAISQVHRGSTFSGSSFAGTKTAPALYASCVERRGRNSVTRSPTSPSGAGRIAMFDSRCSSHN